MGFELEYRCIYRPDIWRSSEHYPYPFNTLEEAVAAGQYLAQATGRTYRVHDGYNVLWQSGIRLHLKI